MPNLTLVYPPRVSDLLEPPGPKPGYLAWEEAEADLANHPLYVLELDDSRLEQFVLLPFYDENGWPVGYHIVGEQIDGDITPWISGERFAEVEAALIFPSD